MRKISFLLFMLSAWVTGIAQCTTDTVFVSGSPGIGMQTDTLTEPMLPCYGYDCKATYCHSWQLPFNFSGHIELFSNTTSLLSLNVQFWDACHYVRLDTCVFVAQQNIQDWDTILDFPDNAQVVVCNSNEPVTIVIKPGPATDTLPPPFLYVDTLCGGLLPIDPPKPPTAGNTPPIYTECFTGRAATDHPSEPGVYIRSWPADPYRVPEKIVVVR